MKNKVIIAILPKKRLIYQVILKQFQVEHFQDAQI